MDFTYTARAYCLLTKPGILLGNAITTMGGFLLASKESVDGRLLAATLLGLSLIIASGCVFNNYIDRKADAQMTRTRRRALAEGTISPVYALLFALLLGASGTLFLGVYANLLTLFVALFGFFVYVILYSFSKYHSVHGTLIGSVAGAVPPLAGYCAAAGRLELGAWILFAMIVLWQMPHFFAIAINRLEEYAAASIPVLPLKRGIRTTKVHMFAYTAAFTLAALALPVCRCVTPLYLAAALPLCAYWLALSVRGFWCADDQLWARNMFRCSLIVIIGLCLAIPLS
jgi:protoheme IX farnesyltransferase